MFSFLKRIFTLRIFTKDQIEQMQADYENSLRRIFNSKDGQNVIKQWKINLSRRSAFNQGDSHESACWKEGGRESFRKMLEILGEFDEI